MDQIRLGSTKSFQDGQDIIIIIIIIIGFDVFVLALDEKKKNK
jgi:hypothetical protein